MKITKEQLTELVLEALGEQATKERPPQKLEVPGGKKLYSPVTIEDAEEQIESLRKWMKGVWDIQREMTKDPKFNWTVLGNKLHKLLEDFRWELHSAKLRRDGMVKTSMKTFQEMLGPGVKPASENEQTRWMVGGAVGQIRSNLKTLIELANKETVPLKKQLLQEGIATLQEALIKLEAFTNIRD